MTGSRRSCPRSRSAMHPVPAAGPAHDRREAGRRRPPVPASNRIPDASAASTCDHAAERHPDDRTRRRHRRAHDRHRDDRGSRRPLREARHRDGNRRRRDVRPGRRDGHVRQADATPGRASGPGWDVGACSPGSGGGRPDPVRRGAGPDGDRPDRVLDVPHRAEGRPGPARAGDQPVRVPAGGHPAGGEQAWCHSSTGCSPRGGSWVPAWDRRDVARGPGVPMPRLHPGWVWRRAWGPGRRAWGPGRRAWQPTVPAVPHRASAPRQVPRAGPRAWAPRAWARRYVGRHRAGGPACLPRRRAWASRRHRSWTRTGRCPHRRPARVPHGDAGRPAPRVSTTPT